MALRKIGEATTNSDGIATLTYPGTGAGEVDLKACYYEEDTGRIIQSKTFATIDGTFKDVATSSDHNDNWYIRLPDSTTITREADGTVLEWSTNHGHVECENGKFYTTSNCIEFDLLEHTNGACQFYSNTTQAGINYAFPKTGHYKIINDVTSQQIYCDGELLKSYSVSFDKYYFALFSFQSGVTERSLKYANFVVYPI